MSKLYLKPEHLALLQKIFQEHCLQATVWAYGSRVGGDAHSGSDLDLAVSGLSNLEFSIVDLRDVLRESDIPFLIDIFDLPRLPESFQAEIAKHKVEIFPNFGGEYE